MTRTQYETHKASGTLHILRGEEISSKIRECYPLSAQVAILFDKDTKPDKYAAYQAFRADVKAQVDAEMSAMEADYENTNV